VQTVPQYALSLEGDMLHTANYSVDGRARAQLLTECTLV
jgi:hypothetical protein